MKEKFWKILPYSGYVLFLLLGLLVFFLGAFSVVVVRTKDDQKIVMPDLIGKSYIEIHNELQRKQLKVRIEEIRIPEKTDGIILAQSIDPGKEVEAGSKVYLTVNLGFDRITMPDVKGQNVTQAKVMLEKVLSGEIYVNMSIGGIVYVPPLGDEPIDSVIDQIPHAGKKTTSAEKVYLLVTENPDKQSSFFKEKESISPGKPVHFVTEALLRNKIPFRFAIPKKPEYRNQNGLVEKVEEKGSQVLISSFYLEPSESLLAGYETVKYEIDDKDIYSLYITKKEGDTEVKKELLRSQSFLPDELFYFVFYKEKPSVVSLVGKETGLAKEWRFKGDY